MFSIPHTIAPFLFLSFLLLIISCDKEIVPPSKSEFTKEKREAFGAMIKEELFDQNTFQILPKSSPYDSTIYWYIETLYEQATEVMRLDRQSPSNDRWNEERKWEVFIIDDDTSQAAFVLPGGDLFLSTGMLKSFERSYELYYLLTFEAVLMNETFLLTRMIQEYNSITLLNVIDGKAPANAITLEIIAEELPSLVFEPEMVEEIDQLAVNSICRTSIFDRTGIAPFLVKSANAEAAWLASRQTYGGRPQRLLQISIEEDISCGSFIGDGDYEQFVLNVLN